MEWFEWVVWGFLLGGFVIGAAYGAWYLGVRPGREVEGYGGVGTPRPIRALPAFTATSKVEKVGKTFISGLGGMLIGLLAAIVFAWIAAGIYALFFRG